MRRNGNAGGRFQEGLFNKTVLSDRDGTAGRSRENAVFTFSQQFERTGGNIFKFGRDGADLILEFTERGFIRVRGVDVLGRDVGGGAGALFKHDDLITELSGRLCEHAS